MVEAGGESCVTNLDIGTPKVMLHIKFLYNSTMIHSIDVNLDIFCVGLTFIAPILGKIFWFDSGWW